MSIQARQGEDRMVDALAAQRQFYSDAKRLRQARSLATIGLALLAPILVLWWKDATSVLGAIAAVVLLANRAVLGPWERRKRELAVAVQEEFDEYVLDLPPVGRATPPSPQIAAAATRRHKRRLDSEQIEMLRRWYPDTRGLPHPFDALACQRASLSWTARLHTEWASIVLLAAAAWALVGVAVAVMQELTLGEYLAQLFLPSAPAFLDALERRDQHVQRATEVGHAEAVARSAWRDGLTTRKLPVEACQRVQDSIHQIRGIPADVPDFYYEKRRGDFEVDMQTACDHLIAEAEQHGLV